MPQPATGTSTSRIRLKLFLTFFCIGLFTFGGGFAMIPLIQSEVVSQRGWLTGAQFADILAISEMTPGPIAVNSATYVGYETAGIIGSRFATAVVPVALLIFATTLVVQLKFKLHPLLMCDCTQLQQAGI